jgi:Tol biopolymer transport system component
MRVMTKWSLLIGTALLTLWAIGQQQPVSFYQRMPVISDDGNDVIYQAIPSSGGGAPILDVFQMSPQQMTTAGAGIGLINLLSLPPGIVVVQNASRPHFSVSQGMHIVYMRGGNADKVDNDGDGQIDEEIVNGLDDDGDGRIDEDHQQGPIQVLVYDRQQGREILISGLGTDPANRQLGNNHSVCPRINKNGRIIAFASLDPTLHDPNGDGNSDPLPLYATPTRDAPWIIYVHDRDVDGNGTYDEVSPDPTVITVATYAVAVTSFPYVSLSPDTGGTYIAYQVYDSANRAWGLFVKDWRNNLVTDPPVAVSPVKFSIPVVMGITQPVNGALVAFTANVAFNGNKAGVWLAEIDFSGTSPVVGRFVPVSLNNGVNGAPMISPDATFIAFHTTASDIVIPNVNLFDRNGVDDIYVFDLTNLQPVWSTLLVRNLPNSPPPPIGLFDPCVHPSLSSFNGNNLYIAFEHWLKNPATGQQQILVRKVQIIPPSNFLFAWKMGRARRYVPLR